MYQKHSHSPMIRHVARSRTHHSHTHKRQKLNAAHPIKLNVTLTMTRESLKNKIWDMLVKKMTISIYVSSSPTLTMTATNGNVYKNYNYLISRCEETNYPGAPVLTQYRADEYAKAIMFDVHGCVIDYNDMYVFVVSQNTSREIVDLLLAHAPEPMQSQH